MVRRFEVEDEFERNESGVLHRREAPPEVRAVEEVGRAGALVSLAVLLAAALGASLVVAGEATRSGSSAALWAVCGGTGCLIIAFHVMFLLTSNAGVAPMRRLQRRLTKISAVASMAGVLLLVAAVLVSTLGSSPVSNADSLSGTQPRSKEE
jgi:hypothetical protein